MPLVPGSYNHDHKSIEARARRHKSKSGVNGISTFTSIDNCRSASPGVTLIELLITMAILAILAAGILPLSVMTYKRGKEIELRQNLRILRTAIDEYKKMVDEGKIPKMAMDSGYPKTLEVLVEGVDLAGAVEMKKKFLRRIPKDPMTEDGEWGLRSYTDPPDSDVWGGQDVYDVYSQSEKTALDGTLYSKW